jgi:hypothetical protein
MSPPRNYRCDTIDRHRESFRQISSSVIYRDILSPFCLLLYSTVRYGMISSSLSGFAEITLKDVYLISSGGRALCYWGFHYSVCRSPSHNKRHGLCSQSDHYICRLRNFSLWCRTLDGSVHSCSCYRWYGRRRVRIQTSFAASPLNSSISSSVMTGAIKQHTLLMGY